MHMEIGGWVESGPDLALSPVRGEDTRPNETETRTMKTLRILTVLATLALAGAAGAIDGATARDLACKADGLTQLLGAAPAATCGR